MPVMRNLMIVAALLLPIGTAAAQVPGERNVISPHRTPVPGERIDPSDRGRAELYRDQLRGSQERRELLDRQGKADILDRRELLDLRDESRRMDRALER
ncbi:hypothetical protein IGS68_19015 [Skermanella sp. TT6]|uniref:Uncharacterized protein n=1 Tax=Skermanella cutis TaxID=2775420 RepID=A0ABX7B1E3_9PROT|nr:hypothetical protein [Skermanella sp. TT6]QQP88135.1 hypothetical protein IGS68_19015 [Skermanella sp. TT6]